MDSDALERILGEDGAHALRNFIEWTPGAGFALAVLEVTEPRRQAELAAWISARVPGTRVVEMDQASDRPLRPLLGPPNGGPEQARVLVFTRVEEAKERGKLLARLNIQRDELVRDFAMVTGGSWCDFGKNCRYSSIPRRARRGVAHPARGSAPRVRGAWRHPVTSRHPEEHHRHPAIPRRARRGAAHPARGSAS